MPCQVSESEAKQQSKALQFDCASRRLAVISAELPYKHTWGFFLQAGRGHGTRRKSQWGDGLGKDSWAVCHFHEGVSERCPAPAWVQEDLWSSKQLCRGVPFHRNNIQLVRHKQGKKTEQFVFVKINVQLHCKCTFLLFLNRITHWISSSMWQHFTWSYEVILKIGSSGPSRCMTVMETPGWTGRRWNGLSG